MIKSKVIVCLILLILTLVLDQAYSFFPLNSYYIHNIFIKQGIPQKDQWFVYFVSKQINTCIYIIISLVLIWRIKEFRITTYALLVYLLTSTLSIFEFLIYSFEVSTTYHYLIYLISIPVYFIVYKWIYLPKQEQPHHQK